MRYEHTIFGLSRGIQHGLNLSARGIRMRKNDESEDHTSSESAGIVRGAARTATTLSRRGIVGRLPKPAVKPTVIPRGPMPRVLPKKMPLKHVAKVSDRLSTGFDAYDAVSSSNANPTSVTKKGSSQVIQYGKRFLQFSGSKWLIYLGV